MEPMAKDVRIIFLHHSTGNCVWRGGVPEWIDDYNARSGTAYRIVEQPFPKKEPYGWKNYPFDYWNIWVEHAGDEPFSDEPTLEMLTRDYAVIVWKHCFPVSNLLEDTGSPDVASEDKRIENYRLQYAALKEKMHSFPDTRFIVWTGAALVPGNTTEENARRAREFFDWVTGEWDEPGDNIFLWDFFDLQTEGGIYFKEQYAAGEKDSHPNEEFSRTAAASLAQRIVDVIEGRAE
jgi:hypothetical protein